MNCPRCGSAILQGQNKCNNCGLIFINTSTDRPQTNSNNNISIANGVQTQNNSEQVKTQEEPINLEGYYTGKNYDKLKNRKWSWNTFIFGFIYTLYRKLILISLIWIAVDIASIVIMGKYSIAVIGILNVVMSLLFHYIYFAIANNKIDGVKRKYWGHNVDEIIYRVSKKGGTSGLAIFFLGFSVVATIIVSILLYIVYYPQYYVDKMFFRVPSDFESFSSGSDNRSSFVYSDNVNYCTIVASKVEGYDSVDDYIDDKINGKGEYLDRSKTSILGRDWEFIDITFSNTSKSYYYITEENGIVYDYEFNIYNDFGKKCQDYYEYVKYSMTIR